MLSWFEWLEHSWLGTSVNTSTWAFAVIEAGHLLAALGGAILVVDLRLLGFGLKDERVRYVGQTAQPWLIGGLAAAIATGVPLLASLAAGKYYVNGAFWMKMYFFLAALIFTFTIRRAVVMGDDVRANSRIGKAVAIVSVLLWSGVGIMGRGIGFY
jgi:Family of unknown function (DUF6644)